MQDFTEDDITTFLNLVYKGEARHLTNDEIKTVNAICCMFGMQLTATKLDKNAPKESPVRKTNIHLGKDHVVIKPDLKIKEEKAKPAPVVSSTRLRKPTSKYEASAPKTGMN